MKYSDGTAHIELAEYRDTKRHGTAWAADWIAQRWSKTAAVVIDAQSPAMVLLPELKSRGVKVMVNTTNGMGRACGRVLDMLTAGTLKHLPDHGGGERDHEADRQKRRFRLEQGRIRHRHLAVGRLHDGIAGSVDHTPQPEQAAARHALEEKDEHYDGRGHLERGGQTSVGREQPGCGRHRRRG